MPAPASPKSMSSAYGDLTSKAAFPPQKKIFIHSFFAAHAQQCVVFFLFFHFSRIDRCIACMHEKIKQRNTRTTRKLYIETALIAHNNSIIKERIHFTLYFFSVVLSFRLLTNNSIPFIRAD
jgi:hypothetical protein